MLTKFMHQMVCRSLALFGWWVVIPGAAVGQVIIPATDGTGTIATQNGQRFDIQGGALSGDGKNLFHSFYRFGLETGQIANFLSSPRIQAILGRVTGGEASFINGLIQVTGSNANLYLMNPAGIVFGANASLNVPASFTATTATGIGFDDRWFHSAGTNQYAVLNGVPDRLQFQVNQPGSILNFGNLAVNSGQTLALIGGTIGNFGHLSAPAGTVLVATVPGSRLVRISQPGTLLSLEIEPPEAIDRLSTVTPLSMAQLLAGGAVSTPDLIVRADGSIAIVGSGFTINNGDIVQSGPITANTIALTANHDLTILSSQLVADRALTLQANRTVSIRDSETQKFTARAGEDLTIQGDRGIDILTLNHLETTPFVSGGNLQLISDGIIVADAHVTSGGNLEILNLSKQSGTLTNRFDPIFTTTGDFNLGTYSGTSLKVLAGGNITANSITINNLSSPISGTDSDIPILTSSTALLLYAGGAINSSGLITSGATGVAAGPVTLWATGNITTNGITSNGGAINLLSQTGTIQNTGTLNSRANTSGAVTVNAAGNINIGAIDSSTGVAGTGNGGNVAIVSSNGGITATTINTANAIGSGSGSRSGNVSLYAAQGISTDNIDTRENTLAGTNSQSGSITLTSSNGGISTNNLSAYSSNNTANAITVTAAGPIALNNVYAYGQGTGGARNITIGSSTGSVSTNFLQASSFTGPGGNIAVSANGDVTIIGATTTSSNASGSGSIQILSSNGSISTQSLITVGVGTVGTVNLSANGNITTNNNFIWTYNNSLAAGNGGNVSLLSRTGNISTGYIETYSFSPGGSGGTVTAQANGRFEVTSTNPSNNSIRTQNSGTGGAIAINYGTGLFFVSSAGQPNATNSGTVGTLNGGAGNTINVAANIVSGAVGSTSFSRTAPSPVIPAAPAAPAVPPAAPTAPPGVATLQFQAVGTSPVTIPASALGIVDPLTNSTFTLTTLPSNGQLLFSGTPLNVGSSFTQANIVAGNLSYLPTNAALTPDGFNFTATSSAGTTAISSFRLTSTTNSPVASTPGNTPPTTSQPLQSLTQILSSNPAIASNGVNNAVVIDSQSQTIRGDYELGRSLQQTETSLERLAVNSIPTSGILACATSEELSTSVNTALIPTIAALMNTAGGQFTVPFNNLLPGCDSSLLKLPGNPALVRNATIAQVKAAIGETVVPFVQITVLSSSANQPIVVLEVQKTPAPAFVTQEGEKQFYIRVNDRNQVLSAQDANTYIQRHWDSNYSPLSPEQ